MDIFYWVLELTIGSLVIYRGRRVFELLHNKLAPRVWKESTLPNAGRELPAVVLAASFVAVLLPLFLAIGLRNILGPVNASKLLAMALASYLVAWPVLLMKHWWVLEPQSILRQTLDSLILKTDIRVRRVRLRSGNGLTPRLFVDGSMELSIAFFRDTPLEEQAFLLAAALHQKGNHHSLRRLLNWLLVGAGCLATSALEIALQQLFGERVVGSVVLVPLYLFLAAYFVGYKPRYSQETLQFALQHTGDLEAAERAIRRVDKQDANKRLAELRQWWEKQQPAPMTIGQVATTPTSQQQQQTLGRKP